MIAPFERFEIQMTKAQAQAAYHQGQCDQDVAALAKNPKIRRMLDKIPADKLRAELKGYGAWDAKELADDQANRHRILWLAAANIQEA